MAAIVETLLHLLAICIALTPKFVVCQAGRNEAVALHDSMSSQRNESSEIILRNCCFHSITDSENDVTNNCFPNVSFTWNALNMYRISRENLTSIHNPSKFLNPNLQKQLKCSDIVQYTVPAWKNQTGGFHAFFASDGVFQYNENIYSQDEFCVDGVTHGEIQVFACNHTKKCRFDIDKPTKSTEKMKSCLFRCCNYGEAWDISNHKPRCSNSGRHQWRPQVFADINSNTTVTSTEVDSMSVLVTHPRKIVKSGCHTYSFQSPRAVQYDLNEERFGNKLFKVLKNGGVYMRIRKREWILLKAEQYCIDGFQIGEGNYSGDNADSILFECTTFETKETLESKQSQRKYSMAFGILLVICLFFLLVTAIVYVLLWSKHNIHGYTVFGYICALLFAYLFLGISHFTTSSMVREDKGIMTSCGIIGILCHFTFLSVFSWSTVLNYDLWHTFRNLRPTSRIGLRRFVFYCIFAVTLPLLIVITGIYLDVWDDDHSDNITPGYGKTVCYVEPRIGRFYLVIIPIAIILGINLLLFCNTAYSVYQVKKSTQFATVNSTKNETGNQTLSLLIKLGLINGTIWLVEIISWWIQSDYEEVGIISFILDVITILQGVAIFFLFVMKDDILENLRRGYPSLKGLVDVVFRLKNCRGRGNTNGTVILASTTATSYNSRTQEGTSITKL